MAVNPVATLRDRVRTLWHLSTPAVKREASILARHDYWGDYGVAPPRDVSSTPDLYALSEAVFTSVNVTANRVADTELGLYKGQGNERERVEQHKVLDLLRDPNPLLTRLHLFWHIVADMKLNGNAYWFLAGPERGAPTEVWRMYPEYVRLVRDKETHIGGYVYEVEGTRVPLEIGEVIHFVNPNPFDQYGYGFPDLTVAALSADTGRQMSKWNRDSFALENAVPTGLVNIEDFISDEDFSRLKYEWRASYGGGRKTAFLRGNRVQFQPMGLSQKELDFVSGLGWQRDEVLAVFGCNHLSRNSKDVRLDERTWLESYVSPLLAYIAEVLTDEVIPFYERNKSAVIAEFQSVKPRERALDLEEKRQVYKVQTLNEVRASEGLEALDGGDDVLAVHVEQGRLVKFEADAMPEPEPPEPVEATLIEGETEDDKPVTAGETADERAERRESANEDTGDDIGGFADKAAIAAELKRWRMFVLRQPSNGSRDFAPEDTPPFLAAVVRDGLASCADEADVKALFKRARRLVEDGLQSQELPDPVEHELSNWQRAWIAFEPTVTPPDVAAYIRLLLHLTNGDADLVFDHARKYYARHYVGEGALAAKAYSHTAANYRSVLLSLIHQAFTFDGKTGEPAISDKDFGFQGRRLISISFNAAFRDGLEAGGVKLASEDTVDENEQRDLDLEVKAERSYWTALRNELYRKVLPVYLEVLAIQDDLSLLQLPDAEREDLRAQLAEKMRWFVAKNDQFIKRMDLWVNKGLNRIFELGKLAAKANQMMEWHLGATEKHCRTCLSANGQRHRAKDWRRAGILPQGDNLECGGWLCDCQLLVTSEPARGRLSRIPTKHHDLTAEGA